LCLLNKYYIIKCIITLDCYKFDNSHPKTSRPRKSYTSIERPMLCEIYLVLLETCRRRGCWQQRLFHQSQWTRSVHIYDGPIIVTRRMMYCTCVSSAKAICSRVFDNELSLRLVDERSASRRMDGWYT